MFGDILDFILHVDKYIGGFIQAYGSLVYGLLFLIVFVETGLVIMPFLPGDSLLFVAGTFAATGSLNVWIIFILLCIAAIAGDTVNYWLGKYLGENFFSRFINKDHMDQAKRFYERHGKKAIVIARFVPIIRTFAPFIAGIGKMHYTTFLVYNIIGGISWILIFLFAGYAFGNIPIVKDNLTIVIFIIIVASVIPAVVEYFKSRKK